MLESNLAQGSVSHGTLVCLSHWLWPEIRSFNSSQFQHHTHYAISGFHLLSVMAVKFIWTSACILHHLFWMGTCPNMHTVYMYYYWPRENEIKPITSWTMLCYFIWIFECMTCIYFISPPKKKCTLAAGMYVHEDDVSLNLHLLQASKKEASLDISV